MMSTIAQALNPFFQVVSVFFSLPWTIWDKLTETIRSNMSMSEYTAIHHDGVLKESDVPKDDQDEAEEEGESKEENGGVGLHR